MQAAETEAICTPLLGDEPGCPSMRTAPASQGTNGDLQVLEDLIHMRGNPHPSQSTAEKTEAPTPGNSISPKSVKMHFWRLFRVKKRKKKIFTKQNSRLVTFMKG